MKNVSEIKMACDPDLLIRLINSDPAHIARARAKAARVQRARCRAAEKARAKAARVQRARCRAAEKARTDANVTAAAGFCAGAIGLVSMLLALTMV